MRGREDLREEDLFWRGDVRTKDRDKRAILSLIDDGEEGGGPLARRGRAI